MSARAGGKGGYRGPAAWLTAFLVACLLSAPGLAAQHQHDVPGDVVPCAVCHLGQAAEVSPPPARVATPSPVTFVEPAPSTSRPVSRLFRRTPPARGPPLAV